MNVFGIGEGYLMLMNKVFIEVSRLMASLQSPSIYARCHQSIETLRYSIYGLNCFLA